MVPWWGGEVAEAKLRLRELLMLGALPISVRYTSVVYCSSGPGQREDHGMAPAPRTPEINAWLYSAGPGRVGAIRKRHAASSRVGFGPST